MNQRQSQFPNHQSGLNYAFSDEPILFNGMKVIFDQSASVYPVSLESKNTIISTQLGNFQFSFAKTTIPTIDHLWEKIIRKPQLEKIAGKQLEKIAGKRGTGVFHSKDNYDKIVDALEEFHRSDTLKGRLDQAGKVLESINKYLQDPKASSEYTKYPKRIEALQALRNNIQNIVNMGADKQNSTKVLKFIFENRVQDILKLLRLFMTYEYSSENFDFLEAMTDYQKQKSTMKDTERLQRLNNIYNRYIPDTAPQQKQINIASKVRNAIETAIEQVKPFSPSDEEKKTEDITQMGTRPRSNAVNAIEQAMNAAVNAIETAMNAAVEEIYKLVATNTFLRFKEKHSDLVQEIKMLTLSEKCEWDEYPKPQDDEKKE
ncbi:hypothetical protein [Umezakia ovalisporum]|uniref:hypothetical protein n=1 Tax=Umezakia ovalisporum TaxID=75695 RepID=UPI0035B746BB